MKKLMAANWKMFKTRDEAVATARKLVELVSGKLPGDREVLVFPPSTCLHGVAEVFKSAEGFSAGGQNFYPASEGAFTGELSPEMLKDSGAKYGLTGHSERRHILRETDGFIGDKTTFGLKKGLRIVLCVGETLDERKGNKVEEALERQMRQGLKDVSAETAPEDISIAYEPVWAIGTGEVAGPKEIEEAHAFVRKTLISYFGENANEIRILYGGSVKPANCGEIIALDNVDGVLVGGASLDGESFSEIVLAD